MKANARQTMESTLGRPTIPGIDFEAILAANQYGLYCVPTEFAKRDVPRLLLSGEVYEPEALAFIATQAGDGDIVSGGAFIGDFLPALSRALAPGARLHSFEPHPTSFAAARQTMKVNKLNNVTLHQVGIGETAGKLHLQIKRGADSMAAGASIVEKASKDTIKVEVTTLDDLIPQDRPVSVLHLDVEDHEIPALKGAASLLERCTPLVLLEAGKSWKQRHYAELLNTLAPEAGYMVAGVLNQNCIYVPQKIQDT